MNKDKIWASFESEFWKLDARDVLSIEIIDNIATLRFKSGVSYWCFLTKNGVKKHSWRLEN